MSRPRHYGTCSRCERELRLVARGLCRRCYDIERSAGRSEYWRARPENPQQALREACIRFGVDITDVIDGSDRSPKIWAINQMQELGLTRREIAPYFGVSHKTISAWLRAQPEAEPPGPPWADPDWSKCVVCERRPTVGLGLCEGHKQRHRSTGRIDPDRPIREIGVTRRDPDRCTRSSLGYRYGCRCEDCCRSATRRRKLSRHYGPSMTDLDEVREHINMLLASGMSSAEIARQAGLPTQRIYHWTWGRNKRGKRSNVDAVLAVQVACASCDKPSLANGKWCWECLKSNLSGSR